MPTRIAAVIALLALFCLPGSAWARSQRVVVLRPDDELVRAIALALAPFGLETVRSDTAPPGPTQPEAVRLAARLARDLDAEALVWVTRIDEGSLLWVFDVRSGDVTTRLSSETPPFDGAAAAAVALSVKTVLRDSGAGPAERLDDPPSSEVRTLTLEGGLGVHLVADEKLDPRAQLAAVLWLAAAGRLGLGLEFAAGPGLQVSDREYEGRYRALVLGGSARFALVDLPRFDAVISLGGSAHFAMLQGTPLGQPERSVSRLNGSLDLRARGDFYLSPRTYLGIEAGGAYFPRYRRYLLDGDPVFAPWRLVGGVSAHAGFEWF